MYDLIIAGGGPAGVSAGIYAARKKIKTLLVTDSFGGQSVVSADIQNFIGIKSISGFELAKMMEEHLRAQEDIEIIDDDLIAKVKKTDEGFKVTTQKNQIFETKALLICSGSHRRKLKVPGEKEFDSKGVAYCSTCDAPLFKDKVVAVVGGGNAGLEAIIDLLSYAKKVYILQRSEALKGDLVTREKIQKDQRVEVLTLAETTEIFGNEFVTGLRYKDSRSGDIKELKLDGVFVEIGSEPNSDFVKDLVKLNDYKEIVVDHKTQKASLPGIWAAGDVCDVFYKQNNISMGDAVKAVLNIYDYLNGSSRK